MTTFMRDLTDHEAALWAKRSTFNHTHVLTVSLGWTPRGKPYFAVLHGMALNEALRWATSSAALTPLRRSSRWSRPCQMTPRALQPIHTARRGAG